jgi:16S rRNA (guanine527-N7)-methyltransferase
VDRLSAVLERSQELGLLGQASAETHEAHAQGFARAWAGIHEEPPGEFCDLGAGGGVPGLVLGVEWPTTSVVLLEASARRCRFLREAVEELDLADRVEVAEGRAEHLVRTQALEARFPLVTARSFGSPAATAECAVRLLALGGLLIVSEPPSDSERSLGSQRWPQEGLAKLGLILAGTVEAPNFALLERVGACPPQYPRRDGVPAKRPLF